MGGTALNRKIRIGVAGLGFGANVHVPAFRQLEGVEVVAIAGRDRARTRSVADQLNVQHACSPAMALLDLDLDAVSLALPPDQNEAVALQALDRGIGVLCEKPIAHRFDVAERLQVAARGRTTAVDFQFAELAVFQKLKTMIADCSLGRVRHVNVVWLTESWAQRNLTWGWKTNRDMAGGALNLFGSHLLYIAEWLLGPANRLYARCDSRVTAKFSPTGCQPAEDLVHVMLEHAQGVPFSATFGNANPGLAIHQWVVVFDQGVISVENRGRDYMAGFKLTMTDNDGNLFAELSEPREEGDGRIAPFRRLAARFIQSLLSGSNCTPDMASGARVQKLADAVIESAAAPYRLMNVD